MGRRTAAGFWAWGMSAFCHTLSCIGRWRWPESGRAGRVPARSSAGYEKEIGQSRGGREQRSFRIWCFLGCGRHADSRRRIGSDGECYDHLTESKTYDSYTRGWIANILGANAWGTSFIVGDGTVFPRCIHHQVANLLGSTIRQRRSWQARWSKDRLTSLSRVHPAV